eukprot:6481573-Amphidinium_carterae.1
MIQKQLQQKIQHRKLLIDKHAHRETSWNCPAFRLNGVGTADERRRQHMKSVPLHAHSIVEHHMRCNFWLQDMKSTLSPIFSLILIVWVLGGRESGESSDLSCDAGDIMTMEGMTQKHFQHRVPKEEIWAISLLPMSHHHSN